MAQNQAKGLAKHGRSVSILTSAVSGKKGRQLHKDGYVVNRIPAWNFFEKLGVPFPIFSPRLFRISYELVKESDLVHIHDVFYVSSQVAALAAIIRKRPLFITQHVSIVDHPNKSAMLVQRLLYKTIGTYLFKKARGVIVYNVNVKTFLLALGVDETKILQNHNGVDTDFFTPASDPEKLQLKLKYGLPPAKPVILFVGRLVPKKGYDLVYNVKSEEYITLIVGEGRVSGWMVEGENMRFFGSANRAELLDLYRLSDIFVFPAVGEIFTLVMQEAMACGLPIVTTSDKGYSDYKLRRELIGFTDRNVRAIQQKIRSILSNNELRLKMSRYSRQFATEEFNWDSNYANEITVYNLPETSS